MLKAIPKDNEKAIEILRNGFRDVFDSRVIFLGLHGSSRHQSIHENNYSDIDLELILDTVGSDDLKKIKNILGLTIERVECQVRTLKEVSDPDSLIHQTKYKIFMYWAYANSITLLGQNVYNKLVSNYSNEEYRSSILLCIQLTWKDLRKKYFSGASSVELNKIVEVFLFDALIYCGGLDYKDLDKKKIFESKRHNVYELSVKYFGDFLKENDRVILQTHKSCHDTGVFDIKIFEPLQVVFNAVTIRASEIIR